MRSAVVAFAVAVADDDDRVIPAIAAGPSPARSPIGGPGTTLTRGSLSFSARVASLYARSAAFAAAAAAAAALPVLLRRALRRLIPPRDDGLHVQVVVVVQNRHRRPRRLLLRLLLLLLFLFLFLFRVGGGLRAVLYKRMSGWSSKASVGVERRRGRGLKARGGRETRREKSLRIGVHLANAVVWGPVYRTHLRYYA